MKLLFQKINRKHILTFFIFSAFLFLIFQVTFAEGLGDALKNFFIWLFTGIANLILNLSNILILFSSIVFDNLLLISLNPKPFLDQDFVKVIWLTIRDLGNSAFIVSAIFMVFKYMTGLGKSFERSVVYLLIAIFSLNFSFFATRVIVDMGNVTAAVFYSPISISIQGDSADSYFAIAKKFYGDNNQAYSSVAIAIKQAITPSATEYSNVLTQAFSGSTMDGVFDGSGNMNVDKIENFDMMINYLTFVAFIVIVNIIFAKKFFTAGFMFLGRMLRIAYLAIISPIAFVALVIPDWGYNQFKRMWLLPVLQSAFCIAVYMIFLWLTVMVLLAPDLVSFTTSDFDGLSGSNSGGNGNVTFISWALTLLVKIIFTYVLLGMGEKYGKQFCEGDMFGEGGLLGKLMKPAAAALGIARFALNPVGAIARNTIGRAGMALANSQKLYDREGAGSKSSRRLRNLGTRIANSKMFGAKSRAEVVAKEKERQQEVEKHMSEEGLRKRRQKIYGNKTSHFSSDQIQGIINNPEKNKEFQKYKKMSKEGETKEKKSFAKRMLDKLLNGGKMTSSLSREDQRRKSELEKREVKSEHDVTELDELNRKEKENISLIEKANAKEGDQVNGKKLTKQDIEEAKQEIKDKKLEESNVKGVKAKDVAFEEGKLTGAFSASVAVAKELEAERNKGINKTLKEQEKSVNTQESKEKINKEEQKLNNDATKKAKSIQEKIEGGKLTEDDKQNIMGDYDGTGYNDMDEQMVEELEDISKILEEEKSKFTELEDQISIQKKKGSDLAYKVSIDALDDNTKRQISELVGDNSFNDFIGKQDKLKVEYNKLEARAANSGGSNKDLLISQRDHIFKEMNEGKKAFTKYIENTMGSNIKELENTKTAHKSNIEKQKSKSKNILDQWKQVQVQKHKADSEHQKAVLQEKLKVEKK